VEWRVVQRWGGWSDRVITEWHHVIRAYNYQRQQFTWDDVRVRLGAPGAAPAIDLGSSRLVAGDLVLRTQVPFAGDARRALAARVDVKAPLGRLEHAGGSEGWDAALALVGSAELAPWLTGHAMLSGGVRSRLPAASPLRGRRLFGAAEISLVLHRGAWAFVVEDRFLSPLFEDGWDFVGSRTRARSSAWFATFRAQNQVSFGVRRGGLTIWAAEDVTPGRAYAATGSSVLYMSNAPDIAFGVAWTKAL
jgi:hypothetical protein